MGYQDEKIIDGYLGGDTFNEWTDWQRRWRIANRDFEQIVKKNFSVYDDGLSVRMRLADNIKYDLETGLRYILQGKKIDEQEMQTLLSLSWNILETVEAEIEIFDAMVGLGIAAAMKPFAKMFPIRELKKELTAYLTEMELLKQKLETAKQEKIEAYVDKIIDIAGFVAEFIPEVALAKKTAFALGALIADSHLGPQQPDAKKISRTAGSTLAEPLIENLGVFRTSMGKVASLGGKLNAAYDVYNLDEIKEANKNLADIKTALANQKGFHERIVVKIWSIWQTQIWSLERQLHRGQEQLRESKAKTIDMRDDLDETIRIVRYKSPKAWIIRS